MFKNWNEDLQAQSLIDLTKVNLYSVEKKHKYLEGVTKIVKWIGAEIFLDC